MLTALIGKKYKTVLIDGKSDEKRLYQFLLDTDNFIAYLKYCIAPHKRDKSTSWQFVFSDDEIEYIMTKICGNQNIKLIFLCGQRNLKNSEIAIIEKDDIERLSLKKAMTKRA